MAAGGEAAAAATMRDGVVGGGVVDGMVVTGDADGLLGSGDDEAVKDSTGPRVRWRARPGHVAVTWRVGLEWYV